MHCSVFYHTITRHKHEYSQLTGHKKRHAAIDRNECALMMVAEMQQTLFMSMHGSFHANCWLTKQLLEQNAVIISCNSLYDTANFFQEVFVG
jgi:hypothetical protein